jgi:hypothetical protein
MSVEMRVRAFQASDTDAWDQCVSQSSAGTFLHTRRFLSYHGERFEDCSLVVEDACGAICGVFPAALDPADASILVSHPGSTYGGLVHTGALIGEAGVKACTAICACYENQGKRLLRYKAVPTIYHRMPAQDDLYALFRLGGNLCRRDLSCAIDLAARGSVSERRRRGVRKAQSAGVEVIGGFRDVDEFWRMLAHNLDSRHRVKPVHSAEEILLLHTRFPTQIELLVARHAGAIAAGVLLFDSDRVSHAQYIASSDVGRDVGALDIVFETAIVRAAAAGRRYFDFGISTERGGTLLNEGLYGFKTAFGAAGVAHDSYEIALAR